MTRRAFVLADLVAVAAVCLLIAAVVVLLGSNSRRLARLGDDVARLKEIGAGIAQFSADHADEFPTFSWRPGVVYQNTYPDLNTATTGLQAAANQLVYILRTRGNRPDIPVIPNFVAHLNYGTVVLADYLDKALPWMGSVSSGDLNRLKWAADPACFDAGCFLPCQPDPSLAASRRWPYSSSLSTPFAYFDLSPVGSRMEFTNTTGTILVWPTPVLGPERLSNVAHPSQKVLMHDRNAWHFGARQPYCTHPQARLPILLADSSADIRCAANANQGWQPNSPTAFNGNYVFYSPPCWEPPALNGSDGVYGCFRLTRNGVLGRDFGGPEVR